MKPNSLSTWSMVGYMSWRDESSFFIKIDGTCLMNKLMLTTACKPCAVNANLSLHFLPLDTTPHTVVPTTGHGRELEQSRGRTGELIFQVVG